MNATKHLLTLVCVVMVVCTAHKAQANFVFGAPENLGAAINGPTHEYGPWTSPDGLSLYFARSATWTSLPELLQATRVTPQDPWRTPVSLGLYDTSFYNLIQVMPGVTTADGLEVYFNHSQLGGYGSQDLWVMKREVIPAAWSPPINLGPLVNSSADEIAPTVSPDGLELYFSGYGTNARPGGYGNADLWVTRRRTRNDPWDEPVNLGPTVNTPAQDARPRLSADGLVLLFDSQRSDGYGSADLYMMKRAALADPWGPPVNLGPIVNSSAFEECGWLSADGSMLYWDCGRPGGRGGHDVWHAPIIPIVDFNGDGKVDASDQGILMDHRGQNDPLCDIGPFAWGDGVVDDKDLTVLKDYIGKEIVDPTLVAHWALDETTGVLAADSVKGNYAVLIGTAAWQPEGGPIGGALQLDGKSTFLRSISPVLDPAQGPFSAVAWVKGGAPGQTILAQAGGVNWLSAQPGTGFLMSDLKLHPLLNSVVSLAAITDGAWHRVGFVWDGAYRLLYVDGVEVARGPQSSLPSAAGSLHIGADSNLTPGSFWSGLIDDVRIYNRAVKP